MVGFYATFHFLSGHPLLVSGEQRVNMAKAKVKQNYGQLEKEFQKQKAELKSSDTSSKIDVSNIHIKEEPVSDEEPMDTSVYEGLNNGIVNGLHMEEDSTDSLNGHLPGGCSDRVAQELKAFVSSTFRKQFVLTLSELKRLFNLHLASLPPGHILFSGISDKMLQDMVLDIGCKQILVPVSIFFLLAQSGWEVGGQLNIRAMKCLHLGLDWRNTCVLLKLLKACLPSCFWLALCSAFCLYGVLIVVLGAPFPPLGCWAAGTHCACLLLFQWLTLGESHQLALQCTAFCRNAAGIKMMAAAWNWWGTPSRALWEAANHICRVLLVTPFPPGLITDVFTCLYRNYTCECVSQSQQIA